MAITQLSALLENTPGTLYQAVSTISDAGINLRALSVADTRDFGILRVIVSDVEKTKEVLSDSTICTETKVIAAKMSDQQFGYRLNRVAADQALNGAEVREQKDLLPGDIICFSWITSNYINHVGIYIGEGKFIHAMDSANDVLITTLEEYLKTHRCYMRRIVGEDEKTTLAQIEQRERMDAEMLALQMAEEERQAAERARNASPSPTPPPAYIPDTAGGISKEEAEEQHRKEIEEAWRLIWEEEEASQGGQQPGTDEASGPAETPATGETPAADPVPAEPVVPDPAQQESSIPDPAPADPTQNETPSREPESPPSYDPPAADTDPVPETSERFPAEDLPTSDEFTIRISG